MMSAQEQWTAVRMKLIKGATNAQLTKVDDPSGTVDNDWYQVDLINPLDSNLVFVAGIAQHLSNEVFDKSIDSFNDASIKYHLYD